MERSMRGMRKLLLYLLFLLVLLFCLTIVSSAQEQGYLPDDAEEEEEEEEAYGIQVPESELLTWKEGVGSAGKLDGNIVIVSVFTDDDQTSWDFSRSGDQEKRAESLIYTQIAADWISQQGQNWGKDPVFYYDWQEDPDLYYETQIYADTADEDDDPTEEMADFIDEYIPWEELLERYDARSILFLAFVNTPSSNSAPSYTLPFDDEMESDFEIVYILTGCDGEVENPATYAHEILHTFGAPDLYNADMPAYNYNIDRAFVEYCETNHANEIMMTTYDVFTQESYYDHISNELTEITAYYIGWTDECSEVQEFHLQPSQHLPAGRLKGTPTVRSK